jgi:hypothetical protein
MAKRKKGKQGRVDAAVAEAEGMLRKLIDDSHVREAMASVLDAVGVSDGEEAPPAKKKRHLGFGKLIAAAGVIGGAALAVSSGLRNKVLDVLFGAEEEFQYTPPEPESAVGATNGGATGAPDGEPAGTTDGGSSGTSGAA